jgi:methionyl-tRNA synthetase
VLGYLSASKEEFICENTPTKKLHYYVHAKDNIPFHGIILPGLIMAQGGDYHLPDIIVSGEYVTINGEKLSKSKGNYIEAHVLHENFDVDMVRYYFLRTWSEKRDVNFTANEFVNVVNSELVNGFGNLVNRTLGFIKTKFNGEIPTNVSMQKDTHEYHKHMELGMVQKGLLSAMELVDFGNKYFADEKPWVSLDKQVIANVVYIIKEATKMLTPFIPTACAKVQKWLSDEVLGEFDVLWQRLDMKNTVEVLDGKK